MRPKINILHNHHQHHFLTKRERNLFNKCAECFFLEIAVNITLMRPISATASQSVNPSEEKMKQTQQLLDYIATQE